LLLLLATPGRQQTRCDGIDPNAVGREVSVAAPILGLDGGVRAALGIVAHSRAAVDRLAPAVRTAALGIARATH
jgi:hypothetical protein